MNIGANIRLRFLLAGSILLLAISSPVLAQEMAVTIDDLPISSAAGYSPAEQAKMVHAVYATLRKHHIQVIGFAIGSAITPDRQVLLDEFLADFHILGNHTFTHPDLNSTSVDDYKADILNCDNSLTPWVRQSTKYFRYPMLHEGNSFEKKRAIENFLRANDYRNVPVSIDNDEWLYNIEYVKAERAGDSKTVSAIAENYVDHMLAQSSHYQAVAEEKLGRDIKHILLIHMNPLNAAYLDSLLTHFESAGWSFIPPALALQDPVYSMADEYIGPKGLSWLDRIRGK